MLCIHNADENTWIESNYIYPPRGWIGYSDDKAYAPTAGGVDTLQYAWVAGCSSTYTNWNENDNEPNGGWDSQFAQIYVGTTWKPAGTWNDVPDTDHAYCGCQIADTDVMGERK